MERVELETKLNEWIANKKRSTELRKSWVSKFINKFSFLKIQGIDITESFGFIKIEEHSDSIGLPFCYISITIPEANEIDLNCEYSNSYRMVVYKSHSWEKPIIVSDEELLAKIYELFIVNKY